MTSLIFAIAFAAAINPAGHWEGTLDTPQASIPFQVDIAQQDGGLAGAISIPQQRTNGLPLTKIVVEGASITFGARSDQLLAATIAEDGKTMAGTFTMDAYSFPFTLTRTGDATLAPLPASAAVGKELEGTWHGSLGDGGQEIHVVLAIANRGDGSAIATIVNEDEGGLRLPVVVSKTGSTVTIQSHVVESSFSGEMKGSGEIVGTFRQGATEVPMTFHRNE
jgi:hypothetical protein